MLPNKTRDELEEKLIEPTLTIKRKRKTVALIKENLFREHQIIEGNIQSWINDPENELSKIDWRALYLFANQIYLYTKNKEINPNNYYTEIEKKKALQYQGTIAKENDIELPLTLQNMVEINNGEYIGKISAELVGKISSTLLNYNFDIQREATKVVRGNETILKPTLIQKNVLEIRDNLKNGTQETTPIVFNMGLNTSDDGKELSYNPETLELTIHKGTMIDIVDGYHRCKASELAINEGAKIDKEFGLLILNYSDDQAAKYQGQLAKQTPLTRTRQKQLASDRRSDEVVKRLMNESELKGHVSTSTIPSVKSGEVVTYDVLANTIDEEFTLERRIDIHKVTLYLRDYFDMLLGGFPEEFLEEPLKTKKTSVINENNMFIGYIVLASRMYNEGIEAIKVLDYIEDIDFSRNNQQWKDIGFLNEQSNLGRSNIMKKGIKDFFKEIEL